LSLQQVQVRKNFAKKQELQLTKRKQNMGKKNEGTGVFAVIGTRMKNYEQNQAPILDDTYEKRFQILT
jgi:hypothetical protein